MTNRFLFAVAAASLSLAVSSSAFAAYKCKVDDIAEAKNDVDVYDSPVEPRQKYPDYFITKGTHGVVLQRHQDGWCKLQGVAPDGSAGWVAEDHLKMQTASDDMSEPGDDTGMESGSDSDDSMMESKPAPEPEMGTDDEMDEGAPDGEPEMEDDGAGGGEQE